jgi:naphtho-gamma-pyrone polyketide synthase
VVGVCTGSFAAAAFASSRTLAELVPAGVEASLAAFRTAMHSLKLQQEIEPVKTGKSKSWSLMTSLTETQAMEVVQGFNAEAVITATVKA